MNTVILTSQRGDGELRIDRTDSADIWEVAVDVAGLHARTRVNAAGAAATGWQHSSSVLVSDPEQGLDELCMFLTDHLDGWFAEETWHSLDGRLQLGFGHRDDHVCVAVTLRHNGDGGWVTSTHLDIAVRDVNALVARLRSLTDAVALTS